MYQEHFGLRQRPFPSTPDPACYYPATSHERALVRLQRGLEDGEGLLLLTGEAGTGKTLLCHCLLDRLGPESATVLLTNSHFPSRAALLQAVLYDLSLPYQGLGEQELRLALTDHLLQAFGAGRRTVLVLDEAHHLGVDLLEELRLWGNLEAPRGKALQVVLVGQPPLLETLARPEAAAVRQRLVVRARIDALGVQEAADYLLHHLRLAGGRPERLLADDAAEVLARRTGGVPRVLNQAAHQALTLAAEAGAAQVDVEAALEALALLGLESAAEEADGADLGQGIGAVFSVQTGPLAVLTPPQETEETSTETAEDAACRLFFSPPEAG
jgi:type II secretory pathway predicted ATPase ExeA